MSASKAQQALAKPFELGWQVKQKIKDRPNRWVLHTLSKNYVLRSEVPRKLRWLTGEIWQILLSHTGQQKRRSKEEMKRPKPKKRDVAVEDRKARTLLSKNEQRAEVEYSMYSKLTESSRWSMHVLRGLVKYNYAQKYQRNIIENLIFEPVGKKYSGTRRSLRTRRRLLFLRSLFAMSDTKIQ